jgi:hypothetical protein
MPANAALISTVIIDRPVCVACISQKSGLSAEEIHSYLSRVAAAVSVIRDTAACRACGMIKCSRCRGPSNDRRLTCSAVWHALDA